MLFGVLGLILLRPFNLNLSRPTAVLIFLAVIEIIGLTTAQLPHFDTGLYHLQVIRWLQDSRIVFGLGNIHDRLSFNSLWFPAVTATGFPGAPLTGPFLSMTVLYLLFLAALIDLLPASGPLEPRLKLSECFSWIILIFFAMPGATLGSDFFVPNLGSPSTDLPAIVFTLLSFAFTLRAFEEQTRQKREQWVSLVWFCAVTSFLIKASQLPVLLLPLSFAVFEGIIPKKALAIVSGIGVFWSARGIVTSGCFLYPAVGSCVDTFHWTIPREIAMSESAWIRSWARNSALPPDQVLGNWKWIPVWAKLFRTTSWAKATLNLLIGGCALVIVPRMIPSSALKKCFEKFNLLSTESLKNTTRSNRSFMICTVIAIVGVLFWFLQAPDPRYGFGFILSLAVLVLSKAFQMGIYSQMASRFFRPSLAIAGLLFFVAHLNVFPTSPRDLKFDFPSLPQTHGTQHVSDSGVSVWIPEKDGQCWDLPRPCTPALNPRLKQSFIGNYLLYSVQ